MAKKAETEENTPRKFSKDVILNSKDQYVREHKLVFKVVLQDGEMYTLEKAKELVKKWLEREVK